jgi:replication factor C subunit 1
MRKLYHSSILDWKKADCIFRKQESPKGQEITTDDYFASSKSKSTKATSSRASAVKAANPVTSTPSKPKSKPVSNGQRSTQKKQTVSYNHDDANALSELEGSGDDIFADDVRKTGRRKDDDYVEVEDNDDVEMRNKDADDDFVVPDDEEDIVSRRPARNNGSKKRKSIELDSEEDESDAPKKGTKASSTAKKPAAKKLKGKKEEVDENAEMQAIYDSIPTVKAPSPPPKDPNSKFDWRKAQGGGNAGPPPAAGSKEMPDGAENCLAGLNFVFTGLLDTISREEGTELVKRYGGKITGAPSGKTSYVVLGSDAGPSKLEKIKKLSIKTINEDGLFELIRRLPANGGTGKAAEKSMEKKKVDEAKIKAEAAAMEREEKARAAEAEKAEQKKRAALGASAPANTRPKPALNSQLWTTKYAPSSMNQICGNKAGVEKLQKWLQGWQRNHKLGFKLGGADGMGTYRTVIIHGPPGIGKTTAAHLAAKLGGYDVIESNASDTRSKKLVESGLHDVLNNTSLLGYFAGDGQDVSEQKKKIVLVMDEVDGMSAGDRGGVGALAKVCKKTDIPMILICNDRRLPKMKPFDHVAYDLPFRRPTTEMVRSRIATICHREGLKLPPPVIDALIEGSNKDIRQIINMISQVKLDQTAMDFNDSKAMAKAWEKHVVLKPWDICQKLLGGGMFAPSSKSTLNDKIELYFNDHEFSYLMIQENYLSTKPLLLNTAGLSAREQRLKALELVDQAAESISDGDLVDRMIHGSQQQWSLMPTHAVFSTVRPASFISGSLAGGTGFTKWLGNNSKYGKLTRYVKEIQSHMRLRTSGDRHEIRQQYLPVLWAQLIGRLQREGKDSVEDIVELMDSYFLTKDDFDYIMELVVGDIEMEKIKIETQAKATFTRVYVPYFFYQDTLTRRHFTDHFLATINDPILYHS